MKLRRLPEDFQVEELTDHTPAGGPYALYRLTKTSMGTPEAVQSVVRRWGIARKKISYGGLKDRHAVTVQHLTILKGPRRDLQQQHLQLVYLGQTNAPFTAASFSGNRFQLVLRDMSADDIALAQQAVEEVRQSVLPNYFDDQRFGSLGLSGEWVARSWCLGDWERALWLALADPHEHDSSSEKRQKQILRDLWGQWPECKSQLERSHRRSIVTYLSDKVSAGKPPDCRGALARISVDLRGLYLSAYQSALWNRLLNRYLQSICPSSTSMTCRLASGPAVFPIQLAPQLLHDLKNLQLPLPSARIDPPEGIIGQLLEEILRDEQIELRQLRVKYPRDSFFSRGLRSAVAEPTDLSVSAAPDDLYPRRHKLHLTFALPRGSYATILVKRLTELTEAVS